MAGLDRPEEIDMGFFGQSDATATSSGEITVITEGLTISGDIATNDNVYVNGIIKGRILSKGEIAVGPKGRIEGDVVANCLRVSGYVDGNVDCDKIHILPTGKVVGKLISGTLEIHPGGYLYGEHNIRKNVAKTASDAAPAAPVKIADAPANVTPMPKRTEVERTPERAAPQSGIESPTRWSLSAKRATAVPAQDGADEPQADDPPATEPRRWHSTWPRR
jgi:cytoskeletal protein CcmA (bactofilin family)